MTFDEMLDRLGHDEDFDLDAALGRLRAGLDRLGRDPAELQRLRRLAEELDAEEASGPGPAPGARTGADSIAATGADSRLADAQGLARRARRHLGKAAARRVPSPVAPAGRRAVLAVATDGDGGHEGGDGAVGAAARLGVRLETLVRDASGAATPVAWDDGVGRATFPSVRLAVEAAVELSAAGARSGVYVGPSLGAEDGGDAGVGGRALCALAERGGVLLDTVAAGLAADALPPTAMLLDRGVHELVPGRREQVVELRWTGCDGEGYVGATTLAWVFRALPAAVVGRGAAEAQLAAAWDEAMAEGPRLAVVTGPAGSGKTTMAAALALRAHAAGALVLHGRWRPEHVGEFEGIRQALGAYARGCPVDVLRADLGEHRVDVAAMVPAVFSRLAGVESPAPRSPESERARAGVAVPAWVGAMTARRPVLLVLDDLQYAGPASIRLLRDLLATVTGPLLVVGSVRQEGTDATLKRSLRALMDGDDVRRVDLGLLTEDDLAELVGEVITEPARGRDVGAAELRRMTAGSPLFATRWLEWLRDAPSLRAAREVAGSFPEELSEVVAWRARKLPGPVGEALRVAAVVGDEFAVDVVAAVLGQPEATVARGMGIAGRAALVRDAGAGPGRFGFTHEVVRQALLDEVPPQERRGLHARVAEVLSGPDGDGDLGAVAHHLLASRRDVERGVAAARAAGHQVRRAGDHEAEVQWLSDAVAAYERRGRDDRLLCELTAELADAHHRACEAADRDRCFLDVARRADRLGDVDLVVRAALGYGGWLPAAAPTDPTAYRLVRKALARLPAEDSRDRARVLARLAQVLPSDRPRVERAAIAHEAVAMAERGGWRGVMASTRVSRGLALDGPDDVVSGLADGAAAMAIGEERRDPAIAAMGIRIRLRNLYAVGAFEEADELAGRLRTLAAKYRDPEDERHVEMIDALEAGYRGDWAMHRGLAGTMATRVQARGHSQAAVIAAGKSIGGQWLRGELEKARPVVAALVELAPGGAEGYALQAMLDAVAGDEGGVGRARAAGGLDDLTQLERTYMWWSTVLASAVAATTVGDAAWADHVTGRLADYADRHCFVGYLTYLGHARHHLGALAAVAGRLDESVDHLTAALAEHERLGAAPFVGLTSRWLANVLVTRGLGDDAGRAAVLARRSAQLAGAYGLRGLPAPGPLPPPRSG